VLGAVVAVDRIREQLAGDLREMRPPTETVAGVTAPGRLGGVEA
jgi:hypothetical protein